MDLTVDMESVNESFVLRKKGLTSVLNDMERLIRFVKKSDDSSELSLDLASAVDSLHVVEKCLKELKELRKGEFVFLLRNWLVNLAIV